MIEQDARKALALSTLAFAISFAVWGMISPLAKMFQGQLHLSETQTWLLIAVPVLLGALGRLPAGMAADRFGGRLVFTIVLMGAAAAALALSFATTYEAMVVCALFVGVAGASFSVGVAFTSRWFPPEKQGFALGVYGAGNIGQSIALFTVPMLASRFGWESTYRIFAAVTFVYALAFLALAKDAPARTPPKSLSEMLSVLGRNPLAWVLSLFYFVTFGGFVALSIGLPKLLAEIFALTPADAGMRVAGFVVVATVMRPIGGALSDRFGGARVLAVVFAAAGLLALGITAEHIVPFTVGALGVAAFIGLGNGAVFKLVPQHFPKDTGTVTGLVGAMGGLGGFFPPLTLGLIKTHTGSYALGFVFLSIFCFACLIVNWLVFLRHENKTLAVSPK